MIQDVTAKHPLKKLNTFDEYQEIISLINSEQAVPVKLQYTMIKILNSQKSELASYLLLDVNKLQQFMNEYLSQRDIGRSKLSSPITVSDSHNEKITVTCTDACNNQFNSSFSIASLQIYAQGHNTSWGGESYTVIFKNKHTGDTFAKEQWRVSNTIAWPLKELPCSSCKDHVQ